MADLNLLALNCRPQDFKFKMADCDIIWFGIKPNVVLPTPIYIFRRKRTRRIEENTNLNVNQT